MQPKGEVTNVEFREAIQMMIQAVTNKVCQQRWVGQDVTNTSRIREFLRMNSPIFTGLILTKDLEYFVEEFRRFYRL